MGLYTDFSGQTFTFAAEHIFGWLFSSVAEHHGTAIMLHRRGQLNYKKCLLGYAFPVGIGALLNHDYNLASLASRASTRSARY